MLAGQKLGIKEVDDGIWLASFMHYDLGYFDLEQKTLQPLDSPFGTRLLSMSEARSVTHVSGPDMKNLERAKGRTLAKSCSCNGFGYPAVCGEAVLVFMAYYAKTDIPYR